VKIYPSIPRELVDGWVSRSMRHEAGEEVGFHYHDVEEWVQVVTGEMHFISAGGKEYPLHVGQALRIPRGEVHKVQVGPDGVEYRMCVPTAVPDELWENRLDADDMALIRTNLAVAEREDLGDARFFEEFLSHALVFRAADGRIEDKEGFLLRGFADRQRQGSDSVCVLHRTPSSLLLSTMVTVPGAGAGSQRFTNVRLLARGKGGAKCLIWLNYPEPGTF